jgi:fluoride exporter
MPVATILLIACAGALGALARYLIVEWTSRRWAGRFPLATFLINITGAFALGFILTAAGHAPALAPLRLVLGTGFLGGYTTFSTLSFETHSLAHRGHTLHAWANALGSLAAGLLAVAAGIALGRLL